MVELGGPPLPKRHKDQARGLLILFRVVEFHLCFSFYGVINMPHFRCGVEALFLKIFTDLGSFLQLRCTILV